jgi:hypothetical protein
MSTAPIVSTPPSPLKSATPEQLIEALRDSTTEQQARAEIKRRIDSNVATSLAVRYLLSGSNSDREDAFDKLVALCWKAKKNLSLFPTPSERRQGCTEYSLTREFIQDRVLEELAAYDGKPEDAVLRAALEDKFRYIGRRLHSRLTDEIRKRSAPENQEPRQVWLDGLLEKRRAANLLPTTDCNSTLSDATRPRFTNCSTPLEFVRARKDSLTTSLGKTGYEALEAITEEFPQAFEGTDQRAKSDLTRAIEHKRGVSEQAARGNKRDLVAKVSEQMQHGNRDLNDLHKLIANGEDENTLRQEFISGNGRRKRCLQFRIEFPNKKSPR